MIALFRRRRSPRPSPKRLTVAAAALAGGLVAVDGVMGLPAGPQAPPKIDETYQQSRKPPPDKDQTGRSVYEVEALTRRLFTPHYFAPWVAGVALAGRRDAPRQGFFCGATLIDPQWALTASYCVDMYEPAAIELLYGADTLEGSKRAAIREIHLHPESLRNTQDKKPEFETGIALLRIAVPLPREKAPYPRIASQPFDPAAGKADTRVVGWGSISEGGPISGRLLQIDTTVIDREFCNSPTVYGGRIAPDMLCATAKLPRIDPCQGFSGSGLISQAGNELQLIGLVSWGEGCGRPNKPTVYAQISSHARWIRQVLGSR